MKGTIRCSDFRRLVADLIGVFTAKSIGNTHLRLALVDQITPFRFELREPYGWDFATPFVQRSVVERESVITAVILVLCGKAADRYLGHRGRRTVATAEFRPFVEVLRAVQDKEEFWEQARRWPTDIQRRVSGALDYVRAEQAKWALPRKARRQSGR